MIESKFHKRIIITFWVTFSFIILYLGFLTYYVIFYVANPADGGNNRKEIITTILSCISVLYFFIWLKNVARIVIINTVKNTIVFRNFFTKKIKTYSFTDFNGYFETLVINSKTHEEFKAFYLVKDKKVSKKIIGSYYSNIDEIQAGLRPLAYFGFKKFGIVEKLKILFKQLIIIE